MVGNIKAILPTSTEALRFTGKGKKIKKKEKQNGGNNLISGSSSSSRKRGAWLLSPEVVDIPPDDGAIGSACVDGGGLIQDGVCSNLMLMDGRPASIIPKQEPEPEPEPDQSTNHHFLFSALVSWASSKTMCLCGGARVLAVRGRSPGRECDAGVKERSVEKLRRGLYEKEGPSSNILEEDVIWSLKQRTRDKGFFGLLQ
ncbi:hypothetical protein ACLOJK_041387 [Asimina triloba]